MTQHGFSRAGYVRGTHNEVKIGRASDQYHGGFWIEIQQGADCAAQLLVRSILFLRNDPNCGPWMGWLGFAGLLRLLSFQRVL